MATALDREVRKTLGTAVRKARIVAEDGARKALTELGVEDAKRPEGLSSAQADLRNRLRAHARSLGDITQSDGSIMANRLVREIAYEHWHRALFARFLAENNLLIDPEHKLAVSLSDLEDIAKEEGCDLVELAAGWAEPMLPQIFRKDDPVLTLVLPPETKAGVTEIVKGLPSAVFAADDSLGWVYQFWQADEKDQINESGVKIGADELPAVTQLFTEDYMVLFLLENTLGAWWAGKMLSNDPELAASAESEEELREKTSPPGYLWRYLRFVREPRNGETYETATGPWGPAAGVFEKWPKAAKDITVLDPCSGSGHFLVFTLPILVAFRRVEEKFDERAAVKSVLAENLFGLEIDPRCTQIAAFALALASWKRLGGPEPLPRLNLACSGLAIGLGKAEFLKLAERAAEAEGWTSKPDLLGADRTPLGERAVARLRGGFEQLYDLFEKAPYLGSLIEPRQAISGDFGTLFEEGSEDLQGLLQKVLDSRDTNHEAREVAVAAQGVAKAAELLGRQFTLVATNVPYLGRGDQGDELKSFADRNYSEARSDLATIFLDRSRKWSAAHGAIAVVTPHNWWFLASYRKFRRTIVSKVDLRGIVSLGRDAWQSFGQRGPYAALNILSSVATGTGRYFASDALSDYPIEAKLHTISVGKLSLVSQAEVQADTDVRITLGNTSRDTGLRDRATRYNGIATGDYPRFARGIWEVDRISNPWIPLQTSTGETKSYAGRSELLRWTDGEFQRFVKERLDGNEGAWIRGQESWGKRGVLISGMESLAASIYDGEKFSNTATAIILDDENELLPFWCYVGEEEYRTNVRKLNKKTSVTDDSFIKVPFDLVHWRRVAAERYPNGLPKPHSNDPTQWLFDGHPRGSVDPNVAPDRSINPRLATPHRVRPGMAERPLQVAVARLLGYRWPRQTGSSFMDCPAVSEPDEVDRSGLTDSDGIVSLPALAGEADAATRLRDLIRAAWGPDYGEDTIRALLVAEEATATDLSTWLVDEFFDGHCKLFHQTPFIWHVWDGVRGGFSALVNYHRLCEGNGAGRRLLEKLRDSYLGEWIAAQRRALAAGEVGGEQRLIAAEHLRSELTKIIEGDPPYDIFVRWKPLFRQPIGWEPDIGDGVRLNIRPFLAAKPKITGRKDACILRVTPRVKKHAGADRGAEPHREKEDFPWFWAEDDDVAKEDFAGGTQFRGRRYNDFHYTRAFKQRARDAKAAAVSGTPSEPVLEN
ncbi:Eco57I restriction-modification methylase domain-containing protein [Bradyrhizobium japonicum]|uniref:Eco57I restriction-modification methylase domain-containing protein n=1 Tax=Bradyrhizobium japonicum TaxID=375 RepID=UPI00339890A4